MRSGARLKRIEHYCFLRWQKALTREAELFWINKHLQIGEMLLTRRQTNE